MRLPAEIALATLLPALLCATSAGATVVSDWNAAALAEVRSLAAAGRVTLLCGCPDPRRCHRTLLQARLRRA